MAHDLEKKVNEMAYSKSDMNEHISTLVEYGQKCDHITEMGVRGIVSTWAFLGSAPDKLISYDIYHPERWGGDLDSVYETAEQYGLNFEFIEKDVLTVEIEPTDLLFIDTWHHYDQLKVELKLHSDKAKKYIILHDTTKYAEVGEDIGHDNTWGDTYSGKGIWFAIEEFLDDNSEWILHKRFTHCNGLTILERKS
jgi:hypothetical protein